MLTYRVNGQNLPHFAPEFRAETVEGSASAGRAIADLIEREVMTDPVVIGAMRALRKADGGLPLLGMIGPDRRAINLAVLPGGARLALTKRGLRIPGIGLFGQTSFAPRPEELSGLNLTQLETSLDRLGVALARSDQPDIDALEASTLIAPAFVVRRD